MKIAARTAPVLKVELTPRALQEGHDEQMSGILENQRTLQT